MNLQNKTPVFVPREHWAEIEKLSKAALMDIAWDLAMRASAAYETQTDKIMRELRATAEIILEHRKTARSDLTRVRAQQKLQP